MYKKSLTGMLRSASLADYVDDTRLHQNWIQASVHRAPKDFIKQKLN